MRSHMSTPQWLPILHYGPFWDPVVSALLFQCEHTRCGGELTLCHISASKRCILNCMSLPSSWYSIPAFQIKSPISFSLSPFSPCWVSKSLTWQVAWTTSKSSFAMKFAVHLVVAFLWDYGTWEAGNFSEVFLMNWNSAGACTDNGSCKLGGTDVAGCEAGCNIKWWLLSGKGGCCWLKGG